jgi:hypothetical protein
MYDQNTPPAGESQLQPDQNPYAPPPVHVADPARAPRVKPRTVVWATAALWVSFGLFSAHAAIVLKGRWISWHPEAVAIPQTRDELLYVALIYFASVGRNWARLIYAVWLGVRTVIVIRYAPADWQDSKWLELMTAISFICQYVAMYWLFTAPGRRWFKR